MNPEEMNKRVVNAFMEGMGYGTWYHVYDAFNLYIASECEVSIPGVGEFKSKEKLIEALFPDPHDETGIMKVQCKVKNVLADGNTVVVERVDNHFDKSGKNLLALPLTAVFELSGGKIKKMREYFDPAPMKEALGG